MSTDFIVFLLVGKHLTDLRTTGSCPLLNLKAYRTENLSTPKQQRFVINTSTTGTLIGSDTQPVECQRLLTRKQG